MIRIFGLLAAILLLCSACGVQSGSPPVSSTISPAESTVQAVDTPPRAGAEPSPTGPVLVNEEQRVVYGLTNHRADGNRFVAGQGTLPGSGFVDIALEGVPQWLVGAPVNSMSGTGEATMWVVVLDDGRTEAFILENDIATKIQASPSLLEAYPPLLRVVDNQPELMIPPAPGSGFSPPAILDSDGNWVYIDQKGDLVFMDSSDIEFDRLEVDALLDGRILVDENQRLLLLTKPTERYGHGVLGDSKEAGELTLVATKPKPSVVMTIPIPEPEVIEGIAPLWADLTGDGRREIIVTISSESQGARIAVFDENGAVLASGPAIGRGYRWRHQLAIAPFGPNGEIELVDVLTPHIGGVVEFFRLNGDELEIVATVPGFTSHVLGSRNLDMALAGDFDGDGEIELLLPNQARTELGAVKRTSTGAEIDWMVSLDGRLSSNLAAVTTPDGRVIVGAGVEDGTLRLWP